MCPCVGIEQIMVDCSISSCFPVQLLRLDVSPPFILIPTWTLMFVLMIAGKSTIPGHSTFPPFQAPSKES